MSGKNTSGTVASAMAAAPLPSAGSFPFTIGGYRVVAKPREWSKKNGETRKLTGHVLVTIGGYQFPADVNVVFHPGGDKARKPIVEASLPTIRFAGSMFSPAGATEKDNDRLLMDLSKFEKSMSDGFLAWYRKQADLPALTARVAALTSNNGAEIDDDDAAIDARAARAVGMQA